MRVKIGPYLHDWDSEDFRAWWLEKRHGIDDWQKWHDDPPQMTRLDKAVFAVCWPIDWVLNRTVNKFRHWKGRTIKVKVDYYDVWSADHTLAHVILPTLKLLKEKQHGACFVDDADVPEHLWRSKAPPVAEHETDENHFKRWDYVLDEMIYAFDQIANDEDYFWQDYDEVEMAPLPDMDDDGNFLSDNYMARRYGKKLNVERMKAREARVRNGTTLLGKCFRHFGTSVLDTAAVVL